MARFSRTLDGGRGYILHLDVNVTSQNIAGNTSTLSWVLSVEDANNWGSFSNSSSSWNINIGNQSRSGSIGSFPSGNFTISSGSVTLGHNSNGTLTAWVSGYWNSNHSNVGKGTASGSMVLPTIGRASNSTLPATVDVGSTVTINTNRASSSSTHTLQLWEYGVGASSPISTIATGVGASYSWTPAVSLASFFPKATSKKFFLRTITYSGSTQVGRTDRVFTLRAPASMVPSLTGITATDMNADVVSIVGLFVQGLSRAKLTVAGAGVHGSTISSATATMQGTTVNSGGEIGVTQSGTLTVSGKVTDSRGRTATGTGTLSVLPYSPPAPTAYQARRSNASGVLQDDGAYLRVDLTAAIASLINSTQRNAMTIRVRTRARGTTAWTDRNVITPAGLTYNTSFVISGGAVFAPTSSWEVRVEIRDKFNVYIADTTVATTAVTLDLGPNGLGVGKIHEQGALDVAGPVYAEGLQLLPAASNAETQAGVRTDRAITPATLRGSWVGQEVTNWDDATEPGRYWGINAANQPSVGETWWFGEVSVLPTQNRIIQSVRESQTSRFTTEYVRYYDGSSWTDWRASYAVVRGTVSKRNVASQAVATVSVTFPANRFASVPVITATVWGDARDTMINVDNVTATGATIRLGSNSAVTRNIGAQWMAI